MAKGSLRLRQRLENFITFNYPCDGNLICIYGIICMTGFVKLPRRGVSSKKVYKFDTAMHKEKESLLHSFEYMTPFSFRYWFRRYIVENFSTPVSYQTSHNMLVGVSLDGSDIEPVCEMSHFLNKLAVCNALLLLSVVYHRVHYHKGREVSVLCFLSRTRFEHFTTLVVQRSIMQEGLLLIALLALYLFRFLGGNYYIYSERRA